MWYEGKKMKNKVMPLIVEKMEQLRKGLIWVATLGFISSLLCAELIASLFFIVNAVSLAVLIPLNLPTFFLLPLIQRETYYIILVVYLFCLIIFKALRKNQKIRAIPRQQQVRITIMDVRKQIAMLIIGMIFLRIIPSILVLKLLLEKGGILLAYLLPVFMWTFDNTEWIIYYCYRILRTEEVPVSLDYLDRRVYWFYRVADWSLDMVFNTIAFVFFCEYIGIPKWLIAYAIINVIVTDILFKFSQDAVLFKFPLHASLSGVLTYIFGQPVLPIFFGCIILNPLMEYIIHLSRKGISIYKPLIVCIINASVFVPIYFLFF